VNLWYLCAIPHYFGPTIATDEEHLQGERSEFQPSIGLSPLLAVDVSDLASLGSRCSAATERRCLQSTCSARESLARLLFQALSTVATVAVFPS
jgi:hypothetical protein